MVKKQNKNEQSAAPKETEFDERMIIREQERLAREAKRKKSKKRRRIALGIVVVLLAMGIWYVGWGRHIATEETETVVKIEKTAAQTVVFAQITEINGNEITYAIAEELVTEPSTEEGIANSTAENREKNGGTGTGRPSEGGERPDMSGNRQGGFGGRGQMGGFGMAGGMAGNTANSQNTAGVADTSMFLYNGTTYQVGNETVTAYIPVGTDVTTKLGTVTTFSRLAAEDCIALVMEKDGDEEIIVAVYIVG